MAPDSDKPPSSATNARLLPLRMPKLMGPGTATETAPDCRITEECSCRRCGASRVRNCGGDSAQARPSQPEHGPQPAGSIPRPSQFTTPCRSMSAAQVLSGSAHRPSAAAGSECRVDHPCAGKARLPSRCRHCRSRCLPRSVMRGFGKPRIMGTAPRRRAARRGRRRRPCRPRSGPQRTPSSRMNPRKR
jgi:hypothetical protein